MSHSTFKSFSLYVMRFAFSGGIATGLHWAVMAGLILLQQNALLATATGALAGAMLNYFLQLHITFEGQPRHRTALPAYVLAVIISWLANLALFALLHHGLNWAPLPAQFVTTAVVTLLNLYWYKRFVFNDRFASRLAS